MELFGTSLLDWQATCLIVQPIHDSGLSRLAAEGLNVAMSADECPPERIVAAVARNAGFSATTMAALPNLRVIAVHGVGYDPVDVQAATHLRIAVTNTPRANTRSVAEQAIGLLFAIAKQSSAADAAARSGDFGFKYRADLLELAGLSFGIIGFGAVGQATASIAAALGMRVSAYSTHQSDAVFSDLGISRAASSDAIFSSSDVVSLHLRSTPATRHLIGARELSLMRRSAILLNTGRGDTVDEAALICALSAGTIRAAGLDVFASEAMPADHPLLALPNVVLSPHVAGSTEGALRRTALEAAECVIDVLAGRRPDNLVNREVWPKGRQGRGIG